MILQYADDTDAAELQLIYSYIRWKSWAFITELVPSTPLPLVLMADGQRCYGFDALLAYQPTKRHGQDDAASGEARKEKGTCAVKNKHKLWIDAAVAEIESVSRKLDEFTADDLRHMTPPTPKCMGTAFLIASRRKLITHVGWQASRTPCVHAKQMMVWRRADL